MHEGDHGIIDDTQKEFESKFGHSDHKHDHSHDHEHEHKHHHASTNTGIGKDLIIKVIAGIIIAALVVIFIKYKFF